MTPQDLTTLQSVPAARLRGKRNRSRGQNTEALFRNRLIALGVLMVERIETGWRVQRCPTTRRIIGATQAAKVAGDYRGILKGGRSVLVECKFRAERLQFSALEAHQVDALNRHHDAGGLSLLAWAWASGTALMAWPIPGFGPRISLQISQATALNLERIPERTP